MVNSFGVIPIDIGSLSIPRNPGIFVRLCLGWVVCVDIVGVPLFFFRVRFSH